MPNRGPFMMRVARFVSSVHDVDGWPEFFTKILPNQDVAQSSLYENGFDADDIADAAFACYLTDAALALSFCSDDDCTREDRADLFTDAHIHVKQFVSGVFIHGLLGALSLHRQSMDAAQDLDLREVLKHRAEKGEWPSSLKHRAATAPMQMGLPKDLDIERTMESFLAWVGITPNDMGVSYDESGDAGYLGVDLRSLSTEQFGMMMSKAFMLYSHALAAGVLGDIERMGRGEDADNDE